MLEFIAYTLIIVGVAGIAYECIGYLHAKKREVSIKQRSKRTEPMPF